MSLPLLERSLNQRWDGDTPEAGLALHAPLVEPPAVRCIADLDVVALVASPLDAEGFR